jgi:hypothetical protein
VQPASADVSFESIAAIREANLATRTLRFEPIAIDWFDPGVVDCQPVIGGRFFISSDRSPMLPSSIGRRYTLRYVAPSGATYALGGPLFESFDDATRVLRENMARGISVERAPAGLALVEDRDYPWQVFVGVLPIDLFCTHAQAHECCEQLSRLLAHEAA